MERSRYRTVLTEHLLLVIFRDEYRTRRLVLRLRQISELSKAFLPSVKQFLQDDGSNLFVDVFCLILPPNPINVLREKSMTIFIML